MPEMRISFLLNALVKEMNNRADLLLKEKFEITYSQFVFLLIIQENPGLDVTRLANALGVTKGAVSKRLGWFSNRGLIEMGRKPGNSKMVIVSVTKKGALLAKSAGNFLEKEFLSTISRSSEINQDLLRKEVKGMLKLLYEKRG